MNNKVDLTDDELSAIATALEFTIAGIEQNMEDRNIKNAHIDEAHMIMSNLYERLKKDYF